MDNHDQQRQLWKPEKGGPPSSPVCRGELSMGVKSFSKLNIASMFC